MYRGLNRPERAGWIAGLTPVQAFTCMALCAPVMWALSRGEWRATLLLALVCGVAAALVVVPVRGRPALRWVWHLLCHQWGVLTGWSAWQSHAAAGAADDPDMPDLPGVLQRLSFPDGPVLRDQGRVCLIHDTVEGRWAATARLRHGGVATLSAEQCDRLATRLGGLLLSLGHRGVADRVSLLVRTVPDDGSEYEQWRRAHADPAAPAVARRAAAELDRVVGALAVRHEVYLTVSASEDALRRPAAAAGGGVNGRARVLYRVLDGLEDPLRALGVTSVQWLSGPAVSAAIRTGFNPAATRPTVLNEAASDVDGAGHGGWAWAAAGPGRAPAPTIRCYAHDEFRTVSYTALLPEATTFGALAPLLAVSAPGERRTLAVHYEVLDARRAARAARGHRFRTGAMRDWKSGKGFAVTASDARQASSAQAQEHAVAAGHSIVRTALACAVTVPRTADVEDHAARFETDGAARQLRLLRLELAQDTGFVAAVLPLGVGLPRARAGTL